MPEVTVDGSPKDSYIGGPSEGTVAPVWVVDVVAMAPVTPRTTRRP